MSYDIWLFPEGEMLVIKIDIPDCEGDCFDRYTIDYRVNYKGNERIVTETFKDMEVRDNEFDCMVEDKARKVFEDTIEIMDVIYEG